MGRERNPRRNEAMRIYLESEGAVKPKDLAEQLGVPSARVRKWKLEDKWDEELAKPVEKRNVPKRKIGTPFGCKNALGNKGGKGGPIGNKNAAGHGAPRHNVNGLKTGEYATIWLDALSDDERELITGVNLDPIKQIDATITLLTIRERRMLKHLAALKEQRDGQNGNDLITDTITTAVMKGEKLVSREATTEKRLNEKILAIEEALTRVQEKKIRAIETKHRIMKDLAKDIEDRNINITIKKSG